jgi:thiamine-phosphate pyrophosphorylase
MAAGATRVVVVRALTEAPDPYAAAVELSAALQVAGRPPSP